MNPSMPSGGMLDAGDWAVVAELCRRHDLWLLYNAAMERILYDGRPYLHPASLPGMRERTLTVGSVSKEYRMIGWRTGWIVGPAAVMAAVAKVGIYNVVTGVGIGQPGALAALGRWRRSRGRGRERGALGATARRGARGASGLPRSVPRRRLVAPRGHPASASHGP